MQSAIEASAPGAVTLDSVKAEVALARAAQPAWAATPIQQRLSVLRRARHQMAVRAEELAGLMTPHRHANLAESLAAEVLPVMDGCKFLERYARRILQPRRLGAAGRPMWLLGSQAEIHREPFGVVVIIGPANYPLFLPWCQAVQALAAGNAVVLKPGNGGGAVGAAMVELFTAAGLNSHLLRLLPEVPEAGRFALGAGVDKVVFTGSGKVGERVLAELAHQAVPATIELSGCDAVFVRADADLDLVARALRFGLLFNRSETCIAPRRVLVAQPLAAALEKKLSEICAELSSVEVRTPPARAAVHVVQEALAHGARLIGGRILPNDEGITPCVVGGTTADMRIAREDCFAPVLSLTSVRDDQEALAAASCCSYALGATVFGELAGARALARQVRAGVVVVNDIIVPTADPRLPFGGRGLSGYGTTRGAEGLLDMTTIKAIAVRRGRWRPHLDSRNPPDAALLTSYLQAMHAPSWRMRLRGTVTWIRALLRQKP